MTRCATATGSPSWTPHRDGGLVVADLAGRGTTVLPAGYLAAHTEYGWAITIDAAQGATTDVGIVLARPGLDREHLYVALTRGRTANHVHTAPDPDPGDAGPHHRRHGPLPGQLPLPDLDTALAQLARALATSGRQYAAHTLLDPAVQAAREHTWQRHDAARAPRPPTAEETRHREQLTRATDRRDQARHHATTLTTQAERPAGPAGRAAVVVPPAPRHPHRPARPDPHPAAHRDGRHPPGRHRGRAGHPRGHRRHPPPHPRRPG